MARCRSWRPTPEGVVEPEVSAPGGSRRHWARCRNKVPAGQVRCGECADLLTGHADVEVRRSLAQEQGLAEETLEVLLEDPDFLVAEYAQASAQSRADLDVGESSYDGSE